MSEAIEVTTEAAPDGTCIVRVAGRLDAHNAALLLQRCKHNCAPAGRLVLNLERVPFIASSGVGAILALAEELQQGGGALRLAAPSPAVDSVLRLLNLDAFLAIDRDEGASLAALKAA